MTEWPSGGRSFVRNEETTRGKCDHKVESKGPLSPTSRSFMVMVFGFSLFFVAVSIREGK